MGRLVIWLLVFAGLYFSGSVQAELLDDEPTPTPQPAPKVENLKPTSPAKQPSINESTPGAKSPKTSPTKPGKKPNVGKKSENRDPVQFESKGLKGLREQGMVELLEEVVVTQADMRLQADHAKVYFDEEKHDVLKVVAEGNVKIFKTDTETGERIKAYSNQVVFNNKERTIVMEGNARLWRGADLVRGKKITYEMDSGWIKADRVAGEVYPDETKADATPEIPSKSENKDATQKKTEKNP